MKIRKIEVCYCEACASNATKIQEQLEKGLENHSVEITKAAEPCGMGQHKNVIICDGVKVTNLAPERLDVQFLNDPDRNVAMLEKVNEIRTQELNDYLDQDFIL